MTSVPSVRYRPTQRSSNKVMSCVITPQEAIKLLRYLLEKNASVEEIFLAGERICPHFMPHHYGPYMCPGIIHSYGPVVSSTIYTPWFIP